MLNIKDMSEDVNSIVYYVHRCINAIHERIRGNIVYRDDKLFYAVLDLKVSGKSSTLSITLAKETGYINIERSCSISFGRWQGSETKSFRYTDIESFIDWYKDKYSVLGDIVTI